MILTDEQIAAIAKPFDILTEPGGLKHAFARAIESAVLSGVAPKTCNHQNRHPEYSHIACDDCGAVLTDGDREWGVGKRQWFKSLEVARFYAKNGRLPDDINPA